MRSIQLRCVAFAVLIVVAAWPELPADEITVRLVAVKDGRRVPVSELTDARLAPYGGIVATTWLGGVQVDRVPVFPTIPLMLYRKTLLGEASDDGPLARKIDEKLALLVDPLYKGKGLEPDSVRPCSGVVDAGEGRHVITPGDITFTMQAGRVACDHPAVRVLNGNVIEITCVPVTFTSSVGRAAGRSVPFDLKLDFGARNLLRDIPIAHNDYLFASTSAAAATFMQLTLYMIPNREAKRPDGKPYQVDGAVLHVSPDAVSVTKGDRVVAAGRHVILVQPEPAAVQAGEGRRTRKSVPGVIEHVPVFWLARNYRCYVAGKYSRTADSVDVKRTDLAFCSAGGPTQAVTHFEIDARDTAFPDHAVYIDARGSGGSDCPIVTVYHFNATRDAGPLAFRIRIFQGRKCLPLSLDVVEARLLPSGLPMHLQRPGRVRTVALKRQTGEGGIEMWTADASKLPPGFYLVQFPQLTEARSEFRLPLLLGAGDCDASLTLATWHNRAVYARGERVEIMAVPRIASGRALDADVAVIGPDGGRFTCGRLRIAAGAAPRPGLFELDTTKLKPGVYTATATADKCVVHEFAFHVYSTELPSDYPSMSTRPFSMARVDSSVLWIGHHFGCELRGSLDSLPWSRARLAEEHGQIPAAFEDVLARDALLPVIDRTQVLSPVEKGFAWGIINQARLYPETLAGKYPYNPPHTLPLDNERMWRYEQVLVQQNREYASFAGIANYWHGRLYGYWEGTPRMDGHQAERNAQVRKNFVAKTGIELPGAEQMRDLRRYFSGRKGPEIDAKTLEETAAKLVKLHHFEATVLPDTFAIWNRAIKEIGPYWLINRPLVDWGDCPSLYAPVHWRGLDAETPYAITDFGSLPLDMVFGAEHAVSHEKGARPRFVQTWTFSRPQAYRNALLAMTRGVDAVDPSPATTGYGSFASFNHLSWFSTWDQKTIGEILLRYGRTMSRLAPLKDVAILDSITQQWGGMGAGYEQRIRTLHYDLVRAGRQTMILHEEDLKAGLLKDYKAVFLVQMRFPVEPGVDAAIRQFARDGGVVICDRVSSERYQGRTAPLWDVPPAYGHGDGETEFVDCLDGYLKREKTLEAALAGLPTPWLRPDSYKRLVGFMTGRDIALAALVNWEHVPLSLQGHYRQHYALPLRTTFKASGKGVLYDVLTGQAHTLPGEFPVDFSRLEARLFVRVPARLAEIKLACPERLGAGGTLALSPSVLLEGGRVLRDAVPYRIVVRDAAGAVRWDVLRTVAAGEKVALPLAANDRPGAWRVMCRELISGLEADARFTLAAPADAAAPWTRLGDVLIRDRAKVAAFADRKAPLKIVLFRGQEGLTPAATALREALKARGRVAEIVTVDSPDIVMTPLRWVRTQRDKTLWADLRAGRTIGYRLNLRTTRNGMEVDYVMPQSGYSDLGPRHLLFADAILLGAPEMNPMLDDAVALAPRRVSVNYPGAGRVLVEHVWSPFWAGYNALLVSAADQADVARGAKALCALWAPGAERAEAATAAAPAAAETKTVQSDRRAALPAFGGRLSGKPVTSLSIAPDGSCFAATAQLYGQNTFVFERDGRLRWSTHLGFLGADDIRLTAKGERAFVTVGRSLFCLDRAGKVLWKCSAPDTGLSAKAWTVGDYKLMVDQANERLILGGKGSARAVSFDGKTLWTYDDVTHYHDPMDFCFLRGSLVKSLSADGSRIIMAFFGVQLQQLGYFGGYWNPAILALDARTGRRLWECRGIEANYAPCVAGLKRAIACDEKGNLAVIDDKGRIERIFQLFSTVDTLALSPDGKRAYALLNSNSRNFQTELGRRENLMRIDLDTGRAMRVPVSGEVRGIAVDRTTGRLCVGTWAGCVYLFAPDGRRLWESDAPVGGSVVAFWPDGKTVAAGTGVGELVVLDAATGTVVRRIDLMPYNVPARPFDERVRTAGQAPRVVGSRVTRSDPTLLVSEGRPASVFDVPEGGQVSFDKNVIEDGDFAGGLAGWRQVGEGTVEVVANGQGGKAARTASAGLVSAPADVRSDSRYVVGISLKALRRDFAPGYNRIRVEILPAPAGKPIFTTSFPLSGEWCERVFAFQTTRRTPRIVLRLTPEAFTEFSAAQQASLREKLAEKTPSVPFLIDRIRVSRAKFSSGNILFKPDPAAPALGGKAGGGRRRADVAYTAAMVLPNPYPHITPAQKLKPRIPVATFFNGVLRGEETSWARGNSIEPKGFGENAYNPFRYAFLKVKLEKPRKLNAICVYEDPSGPVRLVKAWQGQRLREKVTTEFAVFVHDVDAKQWRVVGSAIGNVDIFHLFTFKPVRVDRIEYVWRKSGDWHIRLAEFEAYGDVSDLESSVEDLENQETPGGGAAPGLLE